MVIGTKPRYSMSLYHDERIPAAMFKIMTEANKADSQDYLD